MEWLKDKKNQPIVIGIVVVVLAAVGVFMYMQLKPASAPEVPVVADGGAVPPDPTATGSAPAAPGASPMAPTSAAGAIPATGAATTAAAQPAAKTVAANPMEPYRSDPFLPPGYKPPKKQKGPKPMPRIHDLPMVSIYKYEDPNKPGVEQPDAIQPPRRMAGLILNDRIYAILETNGKTEIVQPGDMLSDRLAFVDRIEQDKVVLKTIDRKPKYLVVRLASAPRTNESLTNPTSAGVGPAGPMIPMPRGRRGPMGEAGPGLEAPM